ncbi:hypothetical protein Tco_0001060 [Tanacetum coccineum]
MAAIYEEYDTIQASIDADALFAAKLQREDREQYTIKEREKFLAETIAAQRNFKAAQRAAEIRKEKKSMEPESEGKKSKRLKRTSGSYATQKSPKKPKVMKSVKNVTEKEAAYEVNYEPLSRRFPIVNWEYKLLGNMNAKDMYVYKLTRADRSLSYHGDMQAFLRRLDRQDLNDLYSCGVHILFMDGTPMEISMLVEKKYPLIKELLEKMLNLQLEAEEESTIAFELIKFIISMLEE